MTAPDTATLEKLLSEATPGPWVFVEENVGVLPDQGYGILHGKPGAGGWEKNLFISVGCSINATRELGENAPKTNAELIALSPTLAAEVIALRTTLGNLFARIFRDGGQHAGGLTQYEAASQADLAVVGYIGRMEAAESSLRQIHEIANRNPFKLTDLYRIADLAKVQK